jgi:hypothetical protein
VSIAGFRIHPVFDGEGDGGRHGTEAGVGEGVEEVDEVKVKGEEEREMERRGRRRDDKETRRPGNRRAQSIGYLGLYGRSGIKASTSD